jgi:uncharacterized protein YndB with AHSA1/START domain
MTVITTTKDPDALTLTVVAEFDADPARVWEVWEDPRQLERWWDRRPSRRRSPGTTSSSAGSLVTS